MWTWGQQTPDWVFHSEPAVPWYDTLKITTMTQWVASLLSIYSLLINKEKKWKKKREKTILLDKEVWKDLVFPKVLIIDLFVVLGRWCLSTAAGRPFIILICSYILTYTVRYFLKFLFYYFSIFFELKDSFKWTVLTRVCSINLWNHPLFDLFWSDFVSVFIDNHRF